MQQHDCLKKRAIPFQRSRNLFGCCGRRCVGVWVCVCVCVMVHVCFVCLFSRWLGGLMCDDVLRHAEYGFCLAAQNPKTPSWMQ